MNGFIAIAGLLTLAALIALLYPLLRRREGSPEAWRAGGIAAVLIALGGGVLYPLWSNFDWNAPAAALDTPEAMVGRLARRLEKQPGDMDGWLRLGRSYTVLKEWPLAVRAYEHANTLSKGESLEAALGLGANLFEMEQWSQAVRAFERANTLSKNQSFEAAMGLGKALYESGQSDLAGTSGRMFEHAMELDATSTAALLYSALAASDRNELPLAKQRFQRLLDANPPDSVRQVLEQHIKELDARGKLASAAPGKKLAPTAAGTTPVASAPVVSVALHVTLAASVASKVKPGARLFVMARIPGQRGPPLAVQGPMAVKFPLEVNLLSTDTMGGVGSGFTAGQEIEVEARVSNGGGANSAAGDLYETLRLKAGVGPRATLEINKVK